VTEGLAALVLGTRMHVKTVSTIGILIFLLTGAVECVQAATAQNAQSPLGINLAAVTYWSSELPFLNLLHMAGQWITHSDATWDTNEEQFLNLDADGWPKSLSSVDASKPQQFTSVGIVVPRLTGAADGYYPSGRYVVLYDGQGTLDYRLDASLVSRSPGRDVINVAQATSNGIELRITATDPHRTGKYLRNIRLVKAENQNALKSGQVFSPAFISLLRSFRALRFMDWLATNGSPLSSWAARPLPSNAFWGTPTGVPLEVAVQLANTISADPWLNVPHMADDNYIAQMATLVHAQLGPSQKVYVELSNEVWNNRFPQYQYAVNQGRAIWSRQPGGDGGDQWNRNWFGMRTAQMCDIWKSVWGAEAGRVICVLAAQAAATRSATDSLKCPYWTHAPCSSHHIDAVAIAPYFGWTVSSAWTRQPDGGLASLFQSLNAQNDPSVPAKGYLGQAVQWVAAYMSALAAYKLPLLGYEGGQSFLGGGSTALTRLSIEANRDPRMRAAYTTYLAQWKASGGQLILLYNDVFTPGDSGSWGVLESVTQTTTPLSSAPPKWAAIQEFITTNPCWWSNCRGATGASTTAQ
jgi:hypothetical protein